MSKQMKKIFLPEITGDYYEALEIEINGKVCLIPRGAPVEIPDYVYQTLKEWEVDFDELS